MSVLNDPHLEQLLTELHAQSDAQLSDVERYVRDARRERSPTKEADFKVFRSDKLLALSRDKGEFCYQLCRAIRARRVVDVGTSHGVSALYLAAAVRDAGGGLVISVEYEPAKVAAARAHFQEAKLARFIDLREGDFRHALNLAERVDLVLIDGWHDAACAVLKLVEPWLYHEAVVLCDDALSNSRRPDYLALLAELGFRTMTLPFKDGLELSVRC